MTIPPRLQLPLGQPSGPFSGLGHANPASQLAQPSPPGSAFVPEGQELQFVWLPELNVPEGHMIGVLAGSTHLRPTGQEKQELLPLTF